MNDANMNDARLDRVETSQRRRRASKACINCRKRKTKCNYDRLNSQCMRCYEEDLTCIVSEVEKRGGYSNVLAGKEKKEREKESTQQPINDDINHHFIDDDVMKHDFYNPTDAINILRSAAHNYDQKCSGSNIYGFKRNMPKATTSAHSNCDTNTSSNSRIPLYDSTIVQDGILTVEEAGKLVSFFFEKISPFYAAYIPSEYNDLNRIAAEPALLAAVCTIGARCLDEKIYPHVHRKLWDYCKYVIGSMLWECPPNQIRSVIFAVLTIAEWFPGELLIPTVSAPGEALIRHTRICWPLMGQAVRLARYAGLLKHDIQTTIALHFTDHLLACRLGQQPMLHHMEDSSEDEFPQSLVESCQRTDRARLDIIKLLHMANKVLYRSKRETKKLLASGQYIGVLDLLYQLVKNWKTDYSEIVVSNSWADRTTMFEFNHFELYVFSIILIPWQNTNVTTRLMEYENIEKYLHIAVDAAKSIIQHESADDRPVNLKYSPIQWITRLLHASVFLAKALLLGTIFVTSKQRQEIVQIVSIAAHTLAHIPPDDQRIYSRPLEKICKEFSTSLSQFPPSMGTESRHLNDDDLERLLDQDFLCQMLDVDSATYDIYDLIPP